MSSLDSAAKIDSSPETQCEELLPIYFNDPALQELFDERAANLEFDAGLDRSAAESQALRAVSGYPSEVTALNP